MQKRKMNTNRIEMELKSDKRIGELEFVAEEFTRLILYDYLHIYNSKWSLPAKCTEDLRYLQLT